MSSSDPAPAPEPSLTPRFRGRVAVVTGAARGIGRAIAVALAREGCDLVLGDILDDLPDGTPYPKATEEDFDTTIKAVEAEGGRCEAVKVDVGLAEDGERLIALANERFGRLDFLVANAGLSIEGRIMEMSGATFATVLNANLNGVFHVMGPALRFMTPAGRGRIVCIGSGLSQHGEEEAAPYVASKFGLVGLAKTAALEAAKSGVTVNVVLPGPTDTPMMSSETRLRQAVPDRPEPTREDYLEAKKDATPMGFAWVKPEDIAAAVLFLLTDEARFISGATLSVDAADCAHWS